MSIDKSLKKRGSLVRARNVLKRHERIDKLKEQEKWTEGQSVFNLPKVRVMKVSAKKVAKKPTEAKEEAEKAKKK